MKRLIITKERLSCITSNIIQNITLKSKFSRDGIMSKALLILLFTLSVTMLTAQNNSKKRVPLDHSVYDSWKSLTALTVSNDGKFATFIVKEQQGDNNLVLLNVKTREQHVFPRGNNASFTSDCKYLVFSIKPTYAQSRAAKLDKKKEIKEPKDTLGLYSIATQKFVKIPNLKSFKVGNNSAQFIAYVLEKKAEKEKAGDEKEKVNGGENQNSEKNTAEKGKEMKSLTVITNGKSLAAEGKTLEVTGKEGAKEQRESGKEEKESAKSHNLYVFNFEKWATDTIKEVSEFDFDERNNTIYYIVEKGKENGNGLFKYEPASKLCSLLFATGKKQSVFLPFTLKDNENFTFFAKTDTTKEGKENVSLFLMKKEADKPILAADSKMKGIPDGYTLSTDHKGITDKNGERIFYGIKRLYKPQDSTLVESETAVLDVWNYNDHFNQPTQLLRIKREKERSFLCTSTVQANSINDPRSLTLVRLETEEMPSVTVPNLYNASWGYGITDYNYQLESQWDANPHADLYIVDIETGKSEILLKNVCWRSFSVSPKGKYLAWFNTTDAQWYSYEAVNGVIRNISAATGDDFKIYMQDTPEMPYDNGYAGWLPDDKAILVNAVNDIWKLDPSGEKAPENFTGGIGNKSGLSFRLIRPKEKTEYVPEIGNIMQPIGEHGQVYFTAFDRHSKYNGLYCRNLDSKKSGMQKLFMEPYTFTNISGGSADKSKTFLFMKNNFSHSNDLYVTYDNFKTSIKCTDINPQQRDYLWGTPELISWRSENGFDCDGILYKPENFDPKRKYPMLVYFYETRSETLYSYISPSPSRSTINIPYYVSNGYLVFVPDIHYTIGHPGKSALDCIVPGVKKICENEWADADNIGIDGQSWGGYQVAYMITHPEVFKWKAAMAGAPVANMTSAYGGIRWGSGSVRQFQYEHSQSRIGKNLWDGFDLYIENSPLFGIPNIETPLLIMHNDKDEAVPWYQGIELFTAMKRMRKPVWMLQYNGESHNLSQRRNQKDLSVRQSEFFNHLLKGAPIPEWMEKGVPAINKITF